MTTTPIVFAGLAPHAPVLIPAVAGERLGEVKRTVSSMEALAKRVMSVHPDTLVVISPHSPRHFGAFGIWRRARLRGNFARFAAASEHFDLPLDEAFVKEVEDNAEADGLHSWEIREEVLDHGASVPLWYLHKAGWRGPTVVIGLAQPSSEGVEMLGRAIAEAAESLGRRTAVIASGDMSHRLTPDAPCGFDPSGHEFDDIFVDLLKHHDYVHLASIDEALRDCAAEDSVESTLIAVTAVGGRSQGSEVLSYEGPFGVGYCVAVLYSAPAEAEARVVMLRSNRMPDCVARCEDLPAVARCAIAAHLSGQRGTPSLPVKGEAARRGCVFVTLYEHDGELRGCIGTLKPSEEHLAAETWLNAIAAAFTDSRFPPVTPAELPGLSIIVTVLGELEEAGSVSELDPKVYGIVVRARDGRRGVLLPEIAGVNTVEKQIEIAKRKAGIDLDTPVDLQRFTVRCYEEEN